MELEEVLRIGNQLVQCVLPVLALLCKDDNRNGDDSGIVVGSTCPLDNNEWRIITIMAAMMIMALLVAILRLVSTVARDRIEIELCSEQSTWRYSCN